MLQLEMSRVVRTVCRGVGRDYISFYFPSILAVWGGDIMLLKMYSTLD